MTIDNPLWVEKYRPCMVEECILPKELKTTFQEFVNQKNVPNLLLTGTSGVGKTSIAKAMLEQLDCDYIIINASLNGSIDTLRTQIQTFASSMSFSGGRKYVILDEADYLSSLVQASLRNFMEEFSNNCGFILTCNFKNRIVPALQSRCSVIDFKVPKNEAATLATDFFQRLCVILEQEGVDYDKPVLVELVKKHYPDWRRVLNEVQRYSVTGKIDSGILVSVLDDNYNLLVSYLKTKDFPKMRKWVAENSDIETAVLFRKMYDTATEHVDKNSIPQMIVHIAKYSYQANFVADAEINVVAALTEIMLDCKFA